jgi:hypothetical protein
MNRLKMNLKVFYLKYRKLFFRLKPKKSRKNLLSGRDVNHKDFQNSKVIFN